MSILNERLRAKRKEKGITLLDASKHIGTTEATMQRYESGAIKNIRYEVIIALAELYETSPDYLMGWENDRDTHSRQLQEKIDKILDKYCRLPDEYKKQFLDYLDFLLENSNKK